VISEQGIVFRFLLDYIMFQVEPLGMPTASAKERLRRLGACTQEAPRFYICPTDCPDRPSVRTGLTCAIFNPSPRAANRGRRPIPEALPVPATVGRLATGRLENTLASLRH
jgi:hypothetical protein